MLFSGDPVERLQLLRGETNRNHLGSFGATTRAAPPAFLQHLDVIAPSASATQAFSCSSVILTGMQLSYYVIKSVSSIPPNRLKEVPGNTPVTPLLSHRERKQHHTAQGQGNRILLTAPLFKLLLSGPPSLSRDA